MLEIVKAYPLMFSIFVIVPMFGGVIGAYLGYVQLKEKREAEIESKETKEQLSQIDRNTQRIPNIESKVDAIKDSTAKIDQNLATVKQYEKLLQQANHRDELLSRIVAQYEQMKHATDMFYRSKGQSDAKSRELAAEMLSVIKSTLTPVRVDTTNPGRPLIIKLGHNYFRVIFPVPMRIPPNLTFQLPQGSEALVSEKSEFGFTVIFSPTNVAIEQFQFMADAEL